MTHNSGVTDLPISGFPPGGSVAQGLDAGSAAPVPELLAVDSVADVLSAFAGDGPVPAGSAAAGSPAAGPALDGGQAEAISDDERNRYGLLLDRAAERGLLTPREYEVRLADLAAATSVDQMREIVTVLPGREAPRRSPRVARTRTGPSPAEGGAPPADHLRRRSSQWLVLAVLVLAMVVAMVFFAVYAEHLTHADHSGLGAPGLVRALSALRS